MDDWLDYYPKWINNDMVQNPPRQEHWLVERPLGSFHHPLHRSKAQTQDNVFCQRDYSRNEGDHVRLYWPLYQNGSICGGTDEELKFWIFKSWLRQKGMFREKLGLKESCSMKYLLSMAQPYINYDETLSSRGGNQGARNILLIRVSERDLGWQRRIWDWKRKNYGLMKVWAYKISTTQ